MNNENELCKTLKEALTGEKLTNVTSGLYAIAKSISEQSGLHAIALAIKNPSKISDGLFEIASAISQLADVLDERNK